MYNTESELNAKIEWEGGLIEAIFEYGISAEDLPRHTPENIRAAWGRLDDAQVDVDLIEKWLRQYDL